eukprot:UN4523
MVWTTAFSNLAKRIKSKEDAERVRSDVQNAFTMVGVVAALVLSMEKLSEKIDEDMGAKDDWVDCSTFPCAEVHVVLSFMSFLFCIIAVVSSTNSYVWLSFTPMEATATFLESFPMAMVAATMCMCTGLFCWGLDQLWLAALRHGTNLMIWCAAMAVGATALTASRWLSMRSFVWSAQKRSIATQEASLDKEWRPLVEGTPASDSDASEQ